MRRGMVTGARSSSSSNSCLGWRLMWSGNTNRGVERGRYYLASPGPIFKDRNQLMRVADVLTSRWESEDLTHPGLISMWLWRERLSSQTGAFGANSLLDCQFIKS